MNISWEMYRWETTVGIEFGIQALQRGIEEGARTWEMMRMRRKGAGGSWRELVYGQMRQRQADQVEAKSSTTVRRVAQPYTQSRQQTADRADSFQP